jgi:hypothetical protein
MQLLPTKKGIETKTQQRFLASEGEKGTPTSGTFPQTLIVNRCRVHRTESLRQPLLSGLVVPWSNGRKPLTVCLL